MTFPKGVIHKFSGLVIAIAILLVSIAGGFAFYRNLQWDPLGEYPIQIVQNPFPNSSHLVTESDNAFSKSPVFNWDQDIISSGVKCVKADAGVVDIRGTLYWIADDPPGRLIEVGRGANQRGPGCQQYQFANPVPDEIRAEMEKLNRRGINSSIWHLTGTEIPIDSNGKEGKPRTWQTTTFKVLHRDAP